MQETERALVTKNKLFLITDKTGKWAAGTMSHMIRYGADELTGMSFHTVRVEIKTEVCVLTKRHPMLIFNCTDFHLKVK